MVFLSNKRQQQKSLYLVHKNILFINLADNSTEDDKQDNDDELGGLFRVLQSKSEKHKTDRATINKTDCSKFELTSKHDWEIEDVSLNFQEYYN